MIVETAQALACVVVSVFIVLACAVRKPERVTCPSSWWMPHGVSDGGVVRCAPPLVGGEDDAKQPAGELVFRIHCTGGATKRQDGASAWCQR